MNKLFKIGIVLGLGLLPMTESMAQGNDPVVAPGATNYASKNWRSSRVTDGAIDRDKHEYKVMPWRSIREIDVAWMHRVWKVIPVKEKQNQAFLYKGDEFTNGGAFIEILNHAITTGQIVAYSPFDDRFTQELSPEDVKKQIAGEVVPVIREDPETGEIDTAWTSKEFNIEDVSKFLVKEDWIFDRNLGRMVVRIIGIAPLKDVRDPNTGDYRYSTAMYWIHYPTAREVLGKYEVYNPQNLVKRMTWSSYLEGGFYSSYVQKYSKNNPLEKSIRDFSPEQDLRGLMQGEEVIYDLLNQEQAMWER